MSDLRHPRRASGNRSRFDHFQMAITKAMVPDRSQGYARTPDAGDRRLERHGEGAAAR